MLSLYLLLIAIAILTTSGIPACFMGVKTRAGQYLSAFLLLAGSAMGLAAVATAFAAPGMDSSLRLPWSLPVGEFFISIDPLGTFFLVPVLVLPFLAALFGLGYWPYTDPDAGGRKLGLFYGLLVGGMATVTIARDAVLFLIAWEIMAVAAFFAATPDRSDAKARQAGWIYLVATHAGTLCLFAMFTLWHSSTGSFALLPSHIVTGGEASAIFVLAAIGFGFKAGIMPLHFWLPDFYTRAPSHVSGVLSGIMSKMGIYGLVMVSGLLPSPESWWGISLVAIGSLTAVAGILFALGQADMKRLLAYSSVENIGVITIGIGVAILGRSYGRWEWTLLGLGGALFHVWNHGLFKSLLFFSAGAVEKATGTRDTNLLGGLGKYMPLTMALFLVGAVSISALPPLNGFASEWLIYSGLFRIMVDATPVSVIGGAAALLALTGALATAAFVKLFAMVFLGGPRTTLKACPREPKPIMTATMTLLALACAALGALSWKLGPVLEAVARSWALEAKAGAGAYASIESLAPQRWLGIMAGILAALIAVVALSLRLIALSRPRSVQGTWDCGYSRPTNRMQYTGASMVSSLVALFPIISPLRRNRPLIDGVYPRDSAFKADMPDTVTDRVVQPMKAIISRIASRFRIFQQGQLSRYILYVFIITILLLVFGILGVA